MAHTIKDTIERGICIGCGVCSFASGGQIPIKLNADGMYVADATGVPDEVLQQVDAVCPFSDAALDETELADKVFEEELRDHYFLGRYSGTYAGRVADTPYLEGSSSGGMTSWFLDQLLARDHIDAVLDVGQTTVTEDGLFEYTVVRRDGLDATRKSKYYSTTLLEALEQVRSTDARFALVGVPCFIKSVRLLAETDPIIRERIQFYVGLVCGHMKSQFFGESLAWQIGVPPESLGAVDFRVKNPQRSASDYDFGAQAQGQPDWAYAPTKSLVGGSWGHGAFQPDVCNFCDDVFAETADVCFGDAWLPEYRPDWRGTNVVISRNALVDQIMEQGGDEGELELDLLTAEQVAESQAGNFRHRRLGVSVRSADDQAEGLSVPRKRVPVGYEGVDAKRLRIIRKRRELSKLSFRAYREARETGDLNDYLSTMRKAIGEYQKIAGPPLWRRVASKLKRTVKKILK